MDSREIKFGRLLAIANVLGAKVYEPGKPTPAQQHMDRYWKKPASTLARIHKDLMSYSYKFGPDEMALLDLFDEIMASLDLEEFNNQPLRGRYLQQFGAQQHALNNIMGVEEASELWGLSPGTIKNYCAEGKIKARKIGKTWIINKNQERP